MSRTIQKVLGMKTEAPIGRIKGQPVNRDEARKIRSIQRRMAKIFIIQEDKKS